MAKPTNRRGDLTQQEKSTILIVLLEAYQKDSFLMVFWEIWKKRWDFLAVQFQEFGKITKQFVSHTSGSTNNAFLNSQYITLQQG